MVPEEQVPAAFGPVHGTVSPANPCSSHRALVPAGCERQSHGRRAGRAYRLSATLPSRGYGANLLDQLRGPRFD